MGVPDAVFGCRFPGCRFPDAVPDAADVVAPIERYLGPALKIDITVPAFALRRIDECARRHGLSRSGFLVDAANRVIAVADTPSVQS